MMNRDIREILAEHPFFEGMSAETMDFIAPCAEYREYPRRAFITLIGEPAEELILISQGAAALEMDAGNRTITIQTVEAGSAIGWSWVEEPRISHYDVRVLEDCGVIAINAACLQERCERDKVFGYEIYKRLIRIVVDRLKTTRVQLSDLYS